MLALASIIGTFTTITTRPSGSISPNSNPTPPAINLGRADTLSITSSFPSPTSSIPSIPPIRIQNPHIPPKRDDYEQRSPLHSRLFTTTIYSNGQARPETELSSRTIEPTAACSGSDTITDLVMTPTFTGTPYGVHGAPPGIDGEAVSVTTAAYTVTVEPVPFSTATP
ncbi:hypothetical protein K449DRAFT_393381 [Hypoxylon sp. EC38]|nr:hypothetical protein K449DRAFT_393381 [Hypoxylon sp. EC38]